MSGDVIVAIIGFVVFLTGSWLAIAYHHRDGIRRGNEIRRRGRNIQRIRRAR
jgi:hypothetical protein